VATITGSQTMSAPSDAVALHVAAIRVAEVANSVGYLARRHAPVLDEIEKAALVDVERDLRLVAESLTEKAETAQATDG